MTNAIPFEPISEREVKRIERAAWLAKPGNKEKERKHKAAWLAKPENKEKRRKQMAAWRATQQMSKP